MCVSSPSFRGFDLCQPSILSMLLGKAVESCTITGRKKATRVASMNPEMINTPCKAKDSWLEGPIHRLV
ncbi:hypothetical protein AMTR_s00311p00012730 [Amborella trichopoda]|uniref:Uncharacterized protein n=1 Tax=Amborella trichopoda TaxID=13333 RepID=U5D304_AMBTC|nr:hypothetical protein AMTR_s00311p00012730 [Amborella trichopoda]